MLKNALVLMFDSLQHNYLGCYGNTWIKTPNFDRFAREGVLFENAYTEGLPTVPCRRAMHTGRYTLPIAGWVPLSMNDTTIADLCWGRPIDTALIFDCPMYRQPKYGYTRGFDKVWFLHGHEADHMFYENDPVYGYKVEDYHEQHLLDKAEQLMGKQLADEMVYGETKAYLAQRQYWRGEPDRYVHRTMTNAINYLEQVDRNKQFFLWIDSFDPHEPWDPPSVYDPAMPCPYDKEYRGKDQFAPIMGEVNELGYTEAELHHVRMLYAELVSVCDRALGRLMDALRRLGFEENTLMMIVSDHGEPLGNAEHGHGLMRKCRPWPYEELVHAPMFLRAPGVKAGQRIKAFVQSVDVAPTVCDWLGIGVHPDMQGKSLLPLVRGEVEKVRDFAIAGYNKYSCSLINHDWSFIHWLKEDEASIAESMFKMYAEPIMEVQMKSGMVSKEEMEAMAAAVPAPAHGTGATTLDGADQWTCTPGSTVEVPADDELYDRHKDPFQLHNLISERPDIAKELLQTLKQHISAIVAS